MPGNDLHAAFREGMAGEATQLSLIASSPQMLEEEDDSWEGWLPLHNASRWGASKSAVSAAVKAYPEGAKVASKGGYEPLHLCCMGGHVEAVEAIVAVYPEGVLKKDSHGRTPLDEAREGSSPAHEAIVQLLLVLPGVAAAVEAEEALRAARAAELMRSEDSDSESTAAVNSGVPTPASVLEEAAGSAEDAEDDGGYGPRALASRMFRAATSVLWRSEPEEDGQTREQLASFFTERAKYIPMRLELRERKYLRLLEGTLHVSTYTDKADSPALAANPAKRKQAIMRELVS